MKPKIKNFLLSMASQMPVRYTSITEIKQVVEDNREYTSANRLKSAMISTLKFKEGAKRVDNFNVLKKAFAKGGVPEVLKTVEHYKKLDNISKSA